MDIRSIDYNLEKATDYIAKFYVEWNKLPKDIVDAKLASVLAKV